MKKTLVDTDILSLFFRGNENVKTTFSKYLTKYESINISIITYYEIISGLKFRDSKKQLNSFLEFIEYNKILPLTETSSTISTELYADLRKRGDPIDDIDLLIAGIAIANDLVLVTHNEKHFTRIDKLELQDWSEEILL